MTEEDPTFAQAVDLLAIESHQISRSHGFWAAQESVPAADLHLLLGCLDTLVRLSAVVEKTRAGDAPGAHAALTAMCDHVFRLLEGGSSPLSFRPAAGQEANALRLLLIATEVGEAAQTLSDPMAPAAHCADLAALEEECADILIRVFDFLHGNGFSAGKALRKKQAYNRSRPALHGRAF